MRRYSNSKEGIEVLNKKLSEGGFIVRRLVYGSRYSKGLKRVIQYINVSFISDHGVMYAQSFQHTPGKDMVKYFRCVAAAILLV